MKVTDIHVHGMGGFDTRTASRKQILKIAELQYANGVHQIIPTIYPAEIEVMRLHMMTVKKAMEVQETVGRKGEKEARIIGLHLEGPFLNPGKCGALRKEAFLSPSVEKFDELTAGLEDIVKIVTVAPELHGAFELIGYIAGKGIIVSMGHSNATYSEAENGFYAGARSITHVFNAMRGLHHREPGIAGFALTNKDVYVEVIADPYHLHPKTIELIFHAKPLDKIIIVSDSVKETKTSLISGSITNSGDVLMGGSMVVTETAKRLIQSGLEERTIMRCISDNPAALLALSTGTPK
ncbi:MAG: amidohydrolase family protein [Nitrospirae bacterium]|nr:amidohydrolase family protein [Nitrospirota bacterium]